MGLGDGAKFPPGRGMLSLNVVMVKESKGAWMGTEPGELLDLAALETSLAACGRGVRVYRGCRLVPGKRIKLGDFTQVDEGVRVFAGEGVEVGRHVHLALDCVISGGGRCVIGDHAGISGGVRIVTGTEEIEGGLTNPTVPEDLRRVRRAETRIGAHALLFTGVIVLPGVSIGEGAVVAAGSVVHRDLEGWRIYAGSPLVCVGVRERGPILDAASKLEVRERERIAS